MSTKPKTYMIAIAGPSCAGKTETAKAVARVLNTNILPLDSYYRDFAEYSFEQRKRINFDEPAALDHELLIQQLQELAAGKTIAVPAYDFALYTRAEAVHVIEPAPFLVIEGLFALYWRDVRELCETTVYVDAPDDVCLQRRQYRDVRERGRTVESVVRQYAETVRPMASQYVWPTKSVAELVVSGTQPLDHCADQVLDDIARKIGRPVSALAEIS